MPAADSADAQWVRCSGCGEQHSEPDDLCELCLRCEDCCWHVNEDDPDDEPEEDDDGVDD